MITQLLHDESHKFLTDLGFVTRPLIGQTLKIGYYYPGGVSIILNTSIKVTSLEKLFQIIVEQTYSEGREQGKNDAINAIMKNVTRTIFDIK